MPRDGIKSMILEEWEEEEAREPTNPYRVLYIDGDAEQRANLTDDEINAALAKKKKIIASDYKHHSILESRLERAAAFLRDWEKKDDYDTKLAERQEEKTWAILRFSNGVYEGFIKEGSWEKKKPIRHGKGITTTVDGERYEGNYEENKRHGFGWQFWVNGDFYRGQWKRDRMQGSGQYFYSNGDVYSGLFDGNMPHHNKGILEWANGDVYQGEFSEGTRSGVGTLTLANQGGVYNGQWLNGKEHGMGKFTTANGSSYEGQYEEGFFHGQGTQSFPDGDQYVTTFVNGRADGQGVYTWANGDKYEGQFRLGQRCGEGIYTGSTAVYNGEWIDGVPEGTGKLERVVASRKSSKRSSSKRSKSKSLDSKESAVCEYSGQWEGGLKEGQGTVSYPSGNTYTGAFRGDRKHGQGTFTWNDSGNTWAGNFWLDKQHGNGTYTVFKEKESGKKEKKSSRQDTQRTSVGDVQKAQMGFHKELYHHGLLCERDNHPVKAVLQEDPLDGPRGSIRSNQIRKSQTGLALELRT